MLVLDLTDLDNSMIPELSQAMGDQWKLLVVGNKADMIPRADDDYLKCLKRGVSRVLQKNGIQHKQIKYLCITSAKTLYGVEDLVTELLYNFRRKSMFENDFIYDKYILFDNCAWINFAVLHYHDKLATQYRIKPLYLYNHSSSVCKSVNIFFKT